MLGHFFYDSEHRCLCAYNDTIGIEVHLDEADMDSDFCVEGDVFHKLLSSWSAEQIELEVQADGLSLKCGKSKVKLPTLAPESFFFNMPPEPKQMSAVPKSFIKGLLRCQLSMGMTSLYIAERGVTLLPGAEDGVIEMFSTDGRTISQSRTALDLTKVPAGAILPAETCRLLVSNFEGEELHFGFTKDGEAYFTNSEGTLRIFSKVLTDPQPPDFHGVIKQHSASRLGAIEMDTDVFQSALDRVLIMLARDQEKVVQVITNGNEVRLRASADRAGKLDEVIVIKGAELEEQDFLLRADKLRAALEHGSELTFFENCVCVASLPSRSFMHLIAHTARI